MTVTLFAKPDCRGDSSNIGRNVADLKDRAVGRNPSSMRMTSTNDAILLYKKQDWRGGVMFRRGRQTIGKLGSPNQGGRNTFGNNIASARVTPFFVNFNVSVVTKEDGTLPASWNSQSEANTFLAEMCLHLNNWLEREQALLQVRFARTSFRPNDNKFDLRNNGASFPASWKNAREIDAVIVNSFRNATTVGKGKFPWWGKVIVSSTRWGGSSANVMQPEEMAMNVAHELGHFLGSTHNSGGGLSSNIMTQGLEAINNRQLSVDQIQEWHTKLSRNLTRRRNRADSQ